MLDGVWSFLKDPGNRDVLTWIGGGIVAAAAGLWAVVRFVARKDDGGGPKPTVTATNRGVAIGGDASGNSIKIDTRPPTKR